MDNITIGVIQQIENVQLDVTPNLIEINIIKGEGEVQILQFASYSNFPATGKANFFYLAKDTNKLYRWTGTTYAEISGLGYTAENVANKGIANGYAGLDSAGKVPSSQLPSYVDDVIEVANYAALPVTGETGKIYITLDTNAIYRWSGSVYVEISTDKAVWGGITGTLSNQTDLVAALATKQDDLNGTGFVKSNAGTVYYDPNTYLTTTDATSTYVPYTGATADVNLGSNDLTAASFIKGGGTSSQFLKADGSVDSSDYAVDADLVHLTGNETIAGDKTFTGGVINDGSLYIKNDGSYASKAGYTEIFAGVGQYVNFGFDGSTIGSFKFDTTSTKTYTFPNASGTIALTSDIPSLSGYVPTSRTISTSSPLAGGGSLAGNLTLSIAKADASTNGYLSSVDYNTFNDKQAALNGGTGFVKSTAGVISYDGTTYVPSTRTITIDGTTWDLSQNRNFTITFPVTSFNTRTGAIVLSSLDVTNALGFTPYNATNPANYITASALAPYLLLAGGTMTGQLNGTSASYSGNVTALSFIKTGGTSAQFLKADGTVDSNAYALESRLISTSGPLSGGGSLAANRTISISKADTSTDGYISSTDWDTFNDKQDALNDGTGFVVSTAGVITYDTNTYLTTEDAASTYVPYTGATGAVNLGAYDLTVNELTIGKGTSGLSNNTALGHQALFHITTGNYNTGVGHEALHNTSTGAYNTALGQSALFTNTTGGQNTAIGLNALLSNTTGAGNTALGLDSLQHNTTGSSNVALGYNAGSHITGGTTPNTTSASSIYIGRDTRAAADGGANEIVIGNATTGNGSNTVTIGNSSITANYLKGSVNAGSFVKSGGASSEFLKADGSVDTNTYALDSAVVHLTGDESIAGTKDFTGVAKFTNGVYLKHGSGLSAIAGYNLIDADTTGIYFGLANLTKLAYINLNSLTDQRNYVLPDASGTIALTSNIPAAYTLPTASTSVLGGVKVDGTTITINGSGVISSAGGYTLPTATASVLGGVKIGAGVTITSGVISVSTNYQAPLNGGTGFVKSTAGTISYVNETYVPTARTITINGTGYDLSANRSWTISGSDSTKLPLAGGTMTGTITSNVANALTINGAANSTATFTLDQTAFNSNNGGVKWKIGSNIFNGNYGGTQYWVDFLDYTGFSFVNPDLMTVPLMIQNTMIGINKINPDTALHVRGSNGGTHVVAKFESLTTTCKISLLQSQNVQGYSYGSSITQTFDNNLRIEPNGLDHFVFRSDGAFHIAKPDGMGGGYGLFLGGGSYQTMGMEVQNPGNNHINFFWSGNYIASISNGGGFSINYGTGSDYRIKEDFQEVSGLDKIKAMKIYDFKFKQSDFRMHGVKAHELQAIVPYAVTGSKDEMNDDGSMKIQNVDYAKLTPLLVKGVQEVDSKLTDVDLKVIELENKIVSLEAEIETLKN